MLGAQTRLLGRRCIWSELKKLNTVKWRSRQLTLCCSNWKPALNAARACAVRPARFYATESSYSNEENAAEDPKMEGEEKTDAHVRQEILESALDYVSEHGWTRESLSLGAEAAGYASVAEGMFERGGADLVMYVVKSNNERLREYMANIKEAEEGEKMKTSEFIRDVLEHRLRMIIPYIDVWPDAMATLLQPRIVAEATRELSQMVDDIWHYAGDTSTDFNWYTKRGLLGKLFVTMQTVMMNDQSPDFIDSWEFLDRRMKDIATFGKVSSNIQRGGQMAFDAAFAGITVLRNIAGVGERRR